MTPDVMIALINFATRFGIAAAVEIAKVAGRANVTVDEVIEALDAASKKSAQDYLNEAKDQP